MEFRVKVRHFYIFLLALMCGLAYGQTGIISGTVINEENGDPASYVSVFMRDSASVRADVDSSGNFSLRIPAGKNVVLRVFNPGIETKDVVVSVAAGAVKKITVEVKFKSLGQVTLEGDRFNNTMTIDPKITPFIPSTTGDISALLRGAIGVSSNNELSTGYNVRGGNYDENLVYVNDIEVYRPFLARSGQSEGLSFANPDMVSKLTFSPGGFEARYGDKMSSVLDITYKKPKKFGASAFASLMGLNLAAEGRSDNLVFSWMMGARYKTNQYLLRTLDVQGEYRPRFFDWQTFLTFDFTRKFQVEVLGNIALNDYTVVPASRETRFGTINEAYSFKVYFDGKEQSKFQTYFGAISATYKPRDSLRLKFITSAYRTTEKEHFTVMGQYFINQLETDFGDPNFGDVAFNRGIGTFINHGRNDLTAVVLNAEHKGKWMKRKNELTWGVRFQHEEILDKLSEWKYLDSAGYSVPQGSMSLVELSDVIKNRITLQSNRAMGYAQYLWNKRLKDTSDIIVTAGVRSNYWTFNGQNIISPRVTMAWRPNWSKYDVLFKASAGFYYQPPFYREFRDFNGNINSNIKAQQSIHYIVSADYNLKMWGRPFKMIGALYYKQMNNLIPYEIDNVRIRYYAKNNAVGYATGFDFRINGEFVKDAESWASISIMQTRENLKDDYYYTYTDTNGNKWYPNYSVVPVGDSVRHEPGYIPRPTDQRVSFTVFFQDYLPKVKAFKVHMLMSFGAPLPFGPPTRDRYSDTLRMPPFKRVDIGFSYMLKDENKKSAEKEKKNTFKWVKSAWISLEVLNLIAAQNTISYLWVKDVTNKTYAIPNYLTNRQLNLKLQFKF